MANRLQDFIGGLFRYRVGKYDSSTIANDLGVYGWTSGGRTVTEGEELTVATAYACISKIAKTLASLPFSIVEISGGQKTVATDHPTHRLISRAPNEFTTAFDFWEEWIAGAVAHGVAFAIIERDGSGYATQLHPVQKADVDLRHVNGEQIFIVRDIGAVRMENMLVLRNLHGKSPVKLHAEQLGLAKAATEWGSKYFANGGQMTGVLSTDVPLKPEQREKLFDMWQRQKHHGPGTRLLPFGMKYSPISLSSSDAEVIATRKFQAMTICQIFDVPPALVQLDSNVTYNNTEQQQLIFARSLMPWVVRIQQEIEKKLLMPFELGEFAAEIKVEDLHKADLKAQADFYHSMLEDGVMAIDEVREKLGLNPSGSAAARVGSIQVNKISLAEFENYSKKMSNETGTGTGTGPA